MKNKRHAKILELVNKRSIETQEELAGLLLEAGISVTQATVSRDIKELGLFKVQGKDGVSKYAVSHISESKSLKESLKSILKEAVVDVEYAGNILVVKTLSGMAQAAAYVMDNMELSGVLGTIAGDDCIMVVLRAEENAFEVSAMIKKLLA